MSFVSYAQNFEDVMLFRALGHVQNGFYVDVGAQHPVRDSVTMAFYERGWRGINLEPVPQWSRLLHRLRPRDVNLPEAAAAEAGELLFFRIPASGLSTADPDQAARHREKGWRVDEIRVRARPLDAILAEHGVVQVHFLKVDVEGMESEVLAGLTLDEVRPWVLVVEATEPNSQVFSHWKWEPSLLERGYGLVYCDGLNRFYVADEHPELRQAFEFPPNVFDGVVRASEVRAVRKAAEWQARGRRLQERIGALEGEGGLLANLTAEKAELTAERDRERLNAAELFRQVDSLTGQVDSLSGQVDSLTGQVDSLTGQVDSLTGQVDSLTGQVDSLTGQVDSFLEQAHRAGIHQRRMRDHHAQLSHQLTDRAAALARVEAQLAAVCGSTSWFITAPLRLAIRLWRREISFLQGLKRIARWVVSTAWRRLMRYPGLQHLGRRALRPWPSLYERARSAATGTAAADRSSRPPLSASATRIMLMIADSERHRVILDENSAR